MTKRLPEIDNPDGGIGQSVLKTLPQALARLNLPFYCLIRSTMGTIFFSLVKSVTRS